MWVRTAMLRVKATIAPSEIAGIGLFAAEPIAAGTVIWRLDPGVDQVFTAEQISGLPRLAELLDRHGWFNSEDGFWYLSADEMRFMNHSPSPNTVETNRFTVVAAVDIGSGEELTCDYRQTCGHFAAAPPNWAQGAL